MTERTKNCVTHIAGMEFSDRQISALRAYFKEEWQREEIKAAISVIIEVLSAHNGSDPNDEIDQEISSQLLEQDIEDDIVDRFHHKVPEWNEEALREANNHDVGVWRFLYDIIVPEMQAKLRKKDDAKLRTYTVNGKTYTETEVVAIYDMWTDIQNYNAVSDSVDIALDMLENPDFVEYAQRNDPDIMEQCLKSLPGWGVWQDECLSQNSLLLHYLVKNKLKEMYEAHKKEQCQK